MAQPPSDKTSDKTGDRTEPSLELPKLPGFGRRKKVRGRQTERSSTPEGAGQDRAPADFPLGDPSPEPEPTQQILATEQEPEPAPGTAPRRRAPRERPALTLPGVPARPAVAVTGLLVGAAGGAATYGAMAGCEVVRGVSTCGGAPGFFILLAIVVLMILFGSVLLKAFTVSDPGSTSFLAVGVVTVVTMLALLDVIYSPAMFVVIPVLSALAFLLAHWVTTRFEGEQTGRRDWM